MTRFGNPPHGPIPGSRIVIVQTFRFQIGTNVFGSNPSIVPGHFMEQMMDDVCTANGVMEKVENAVRTINGGQGTFHPRPFPVPVMRDTRIRVLQPCVQHQPSIRHRVRTPIPQQHVQMSNAESQINQSSQGDDFCDCRKQDLRCHLGWEHGRMRSEMIHDLSVLERLTVVCDLARGSQSQQIQGPSNAQMRPNLKDRKGPVAHGFVPRRVETQSFQIRTQSIVLAGGGDVRFAVRQMIGPTMMFGMGVLPSKVGDQQSLVQDKSHQVIEGLRR